MSFTNMPQKKSQAIFTVLGHVVEAQRLPESCQLHLQKLEIFLRFTLGVRAQKTWGQLRAFLACCWSQVTTKCYNIDVRILINAGIWAPRVAHIGFSNCILFSALGSIQGYKVQHLVVTWG